MIRYAANWCWWCPYNKPYVDWDEVELLPRIGFNWMPGFRGFHLALGPVHCHLGFHFCDSMSHDDYKEDV